MILTDNISLTDNAVTEILNIRKEEAIPADQYLRIGVKGGGCSGLSYIIAFEMPTEKDEIHEIKGVKVLLDPKHLLYLAGMEIDYQYGLNNRGFIFNNPNATNTCGCGTSFSA